VEQNMNQVVNQVRTLSIDEVQQVAGGNTFGWYVGFAVGAAATGGSAVTAIATAELGSRFEDWVNGN
jgi:hypothetical protein